MIFDYVIIGAGIAGLSCAYFLSKKKADIAILDKNRCFSSASSSAAGLLSPIKFHIYPPSLQKLCIEAIEFYPQFLQKLNAQHLIQSKGELILSDNKDELNQLKLSFKKFNVQSLILDKNHLLRRFKYLSNDIKYGLLTEHAYSINNNLLLEKMFNLLLPKVQINFSTCVHSVRIKDNKIIYVETNRGIFEGENFVFATGSENICAQKDIFDLKIKGIKGILLELMGDHKIEMPTIFNHYYIVPRNNYTLLAGTVVKEEDQTEDIYLEYIDEIVTNIKHFYPDVVKLQIRNVKVGLRPFIEGRDVVYECSPRVKNAYIINGLFRNGILLGPYVAHLFVRKYF